ncbi:MAG: hypothetical protein RLY47_360 [Candidatus Parcubacteria bacterium]|jgi:bifunctional N-acetylglucosamine-1-phosphate-uridyltransferase/glucosamine-1-phosphate-acetyltransferase GlmU-like protein
MDQKKALTMDVLKALVVVISGAALVSHYSASNPSSALSNEPRPEIVRQGEQLGTPRSFVCAKDSLAQDENDVLAMEYSNTKTVDCMFVGCGGIF